MCPTVRPALGRFRAGVQEGPCHQGRQPAVRDKAPAVGASLDGPALLLHGRRSAPSSSRRQHLPATWPAAGAFRAAEHGGIVTGWSLRLRRRVGRISRTRAGAGTEVFELKMSCVRKYRDEHGLRSGFGVCLGDGHVACEVLVSGTGGSGTLHIQTLGPWGGGSSGGFMRRQGPQDTRSGTRCPSPF